MTKVLKLLLIILFSILFSGITNAQEKKIEEKEHSPKKAIYLALALPGAGQIYNKKYWKLPLVYGALAGSLSYTVYNHNRFKKFESALKDFQESTDENPEKYLGLYDETKVGEIALEYRNERDRGILITAGVYLLQVLDAYVDAHLFDFDISDDLSLNISPSFNYSLPDQSFQSGLSLNFSLR